MKGWLVGLLERAAGLAAAAAIVFACAVLVHQHSQQADRAPYVAVDDALANVSTSMVALGRNGFPASPLQGAAGKGDPRRNEVQLNYGYAPFLLGAALDWLFGTSYAVLRGVHVLGLILAIGAAAATLWRFTPLAPLLFTTAVVIGLWPGHWPMFRPDIGAALAGIAAIACATVALRGNGLLAWLGTGFFAATAFGSHQLVFAIVPWAALVWVVAVIMTERGRRLTDITVGPFFAALTGGLLGLVAFATGIGWRLGDMVSMWTASADILAGQTSIGYGEVLARHFQAAWSSVARGWFQLLQAGFAVALGIGALALWRRQPSMRAVVAVALPAALAVVLHLLGLGLYRNWHSGYTLFTQLATAWAAAAAVAALVILARARSGDGPRLALAVLTLVGAGLLAVQSSRLVASGTAWSKHGRSFVSFAAYEGRVLADVPQGATVAGPIVFGLRSGTRHHLVQLGEALGLIESLGPAARERMLPDHILLNSELAEFLQALATGDAATTRALTAGSGLLGARGAFSGPGVRYGETALVFAEPYGETRVLTRNGANRPALSLYDPVRRTWSSRLEPVDPPATRPADVAFVIKGRAGRLAAGAGIVLDVEPGTYLAEVDISGREGVPAFVAASTRAEIEIDAGQVNLLGEASVGLALASARTVHVVLRAPAGRAHVGYFGKDLTGPLSIRRLERLVVDPERNVPFELPPLADWRPLATDGRLVVSEDGREIGIAGVGIPVGYQLVSPDIKVPKDTRLTVRFSLTTSGGGGVGLGFLDARGHWAMAPARDGEITIDTRGHDTLRLLLVSLDGKAHAAPAAFKLRLDGATVKDTFGPANLWVDRLARCLPVAGKPRDGDACR